MLTSVFGKYRFLVVSIALFLIFDLGVLTLNFYISGQIAKQTERINLAGRQRTLTQQMSKAALYIKAQKLQNWVYLSGLDELEQHYTTFDDTIKAFDQGGVTRSAETGEQVIIERVDDGEGRVILDEALVLWSRFDKAIAPLMVDDLITDEEIKPASAFIAANNLVMFNHMNRLTEYFTTQAENQTLFLRSVQVVGISLATINFFIILFHFLRQLRVRDDKLELKQHESDQILSTIDEGVFLLDKNLVIGGQHSRYLQTVFATKRISQRRFDRFLRGYFPEKIVTTGVEYAKLYFSKRVNPELIADINPLKQIKAMVSLDTGKVVEKYLDFSFAPLRQDGDEQAVLVTVKEVTDSILLQQEVSKNQGEDDHQMVLLSEMLTVSSSDIPHFIEEAHHSFEKMNGLLKGVKSSSSNLAEVLLELAREAHKVKGVTTATGFAQMASHLHNFEDSIVDLQKQHEQQSLQARDLLPLTIQLKELYEQLELIAKLSQRLSHYGIDTNAASANDDGLSGVNPRWFNLLQNTQQLGSQTGIEVDMRLRGFDEPLSEGLNTHLYLITVQLMRNSIAHGFESKAIRQRLKKPDAGQISISLSHDNGGHYRYIYEDDGQGFQYDAIRQALIAQGMEKKRVQDMTNTELVKQTFFDRFTTRDDADHLAGRGIGLPLVWQQIRALNGALKIRSVSGEFTQFIIDFSEPKMATKKSGKSNLKLIA